MTGPAVNLDSVRRGRRPHPVLWGAAFGACLSLVGSLGYWDAALHGETEARSAGFGLSHLFFFLCFPWSMLNWGALAFLGSVTGHDSAAFNAPFFLLMPIVAGFAWGALAWLFLGRNRVESTLDPSRGEREHGAGAVGGSTPPLET